jgi:hypothetical protein
MKIWEELARNKDYNKNVRDVMRRQSTFKWVKYYQVSSFTYGLPDFSFRIFNRKLKFKRPSAKSPHPIEDEDKDKEKYKKLKYSHFKQIFPFNPETEKIAKDMDVKSIR